jgi:ankyrin repeat protein|tara:strand:- start:458 stop:856 length:399 start_codon:yes stop_codon:yes gene_type:complete
MPRQQTQKVINESNVNNTDSEGYTDLMRAVENNDINKVKQFLTIGGIDLEIMTDDSEYPEYGHTALSIATYKNNYEIVKLLIEKGANKNHKARNDIEIFDNVGYSSGRCSTVFETILEMATRIGNPDIISLL